MEGWARGKRIVVRKGITSKSRNLCGCGECKVCRKFAQWGKIERDQREWHDQRAREGMERPRTIERPLSCECGVCQKCRHREVVRRGRKRRDWQKDPPVGGWYDRPEFPEFEDELRRVMKILYRKPSGMGREGKGRIR